MTVNVRLTAPATQPLTLTEAKVIIRTDDDDADHDALISRLIVTARERVEQDTRRRLGTQTWLLGKSYWPREPYILLPQAPVQRVVSIEYTVSHTPTPLDADADVDDPAETGYVPLPFSEAAFTLDQHTNAYQAIRLQPGVSWPADSLTMHGLNITYICGYATVPAPLIEAMGSLIAYWYDNPEAAIASTVYKAEVGVLPLRYQTLLEPYVLWRR